MAYKIKLKNAVVNKEAEKAYSVGVHCKIDGKDDGSIVTAWMPKSQVEVFGGSVYATSWIIQKKEEDIARERNAKLVEILTGEEHI